MVVKLSLLEGGIWAPQPARRRFGMDHCNGSIGGYLTKNDAVRFDRPAKLAVHPYAVFARIRSSNARVPIN